MSQKRKLLRHRRFAVIPGGKATEADLALATPAHRFGMALDKFIHDYAEQHQAEIGPAEVCKVTLQLGAIMSLSLGADMEQFLMLCEKILADEQAVLGQSEPDQGA